MTHPSGLELNFILNARDPKAPDILMDVPEKHAGITHIAFRIKNVAATKAGARCDRHCDLAHPRHGGRLARDPDGNVIGLVADG